MSHLISTYAGATGLKVDRPKLLSQFAAVPFDRYITLQTGAGQAAKCYDYWQEVVALIGPILEKHGISIVHLGLKDDPPLQRVYDMKGRTNEGQAQYVVERALLHMGNDSWLAHVAGYSHVPLVALYGSTDPRQHGPYYRWTDASKTRLLVSHRGGGVPTYGNPENPKTINWIPVESACNAVLELLGIPDRIRQSSRFYGLLYNHALFDIIPDSFPGPQFLPGIPFTVRMDYRHDENVLMNLLLTGRKVNIMTRKPIDLNLLARFKPSILSYSHEIDAECPLMYAGTVGGVVQQSQFFTKERDDAAVADLRFRFFDVCSIHRVSDVNRGDYVNAAVSYLNETDEARPRLEAEISGGVLTFKSSKYVISDGKAYLTPYHWKHGLPTADMSQNTGTVVDDPEFWREANHMRIYVENKEGVTS